MQIKKQNILKHRLLERAYPERASTDPIASGIQQLVLNKVNERAQAVSTTFNPDYHLQCVASIDEGEAEYARISFCVSGVQV